MNKEWRVKPTVPKEFQEQFDQYHPITTQLLYNRKLENKSSADLFFSPDYEKLHDPFLFKDMQKAVDRVWQAIEKKERIVIHGDYDADGVTSAAVVYKALKVLGADVEVFIPHRELDGYGINMRTVNNFIVQKYNLVITVDCGITNVEEVAKMNQAGIDVIITDHHEPPEVLPEALALLDPAVKDSGYPFKKLSGAGVAYKLVTALLMINDQLTNNQLKSYGGTEGFLKWVLDIVAVGTVADVVPLIDENRILVKWGLIVLAQTKNLGFQKLLEIINNKRLDTFTIGFQIAPRLNAAGRMNHASAAFQLLITEDEQEAERLANELQQNNQARQKITEGAVELAKEQIGTEETRMIFIYDKELVPGIIGLIAGRLSDQLYRPVIVMTESQKMIVGSGRSIEGFNITQGLTTVSHVFQRFGGHSQACGFVLSKEEVMVEFQAGLTKAAEEALAGKELQPFVEVEAEISFADVTWDLIDQLEQFAPFGEGNGRPLFLIKNVEIAAYDFLGTDQQHLRIMAKQDSPKLNKMILFSKAKDYSDLLSSSERFDLICEVGKNEWNGNSEIEYKIVDLRKATG